jgi:NhaP-type Na+/H+ or K+/H+ antiporter
MLTINAVAVIILLGGWLFARLFERMRLPGVLGMVFFGILCSIGIKDRTPALLWEIAPFLKSLALIVILLRAGLGISRENLQRAGKAAFFMTFVPCLCEGLALTLTFHWLFSFSWAVSGLTAFMLAAVSPAVIVPTMLELKEKGYGQNNQVPTIVLAGASADDVIAITIFSAFLGLATSQGIQPARLLAGIPLSILIGIAAGAALGFVLVFWLEKKYHEIRATEKTLILLASAIFLVEVGDLIHIAALLGVMTLGFIILEKSDQIAREIAAKLGKIWVFAEIVLFVLIGYSVDAEVALGAGINGLVAIFTGLVFRSIGVWIATMGSRLNNNERYFCILAYLPKATVQAALGSVALNNGIGDGQTVLAIAVLAIIATAPLGLFCIRHFSPKLLQLEL